MRRKLVAAIACRNQGSRLYGKPMQNLDSQNGITILDNLISCIKGIESVESIVLGISEGSHNHIFVDYARKNSLDFIIGDEKDVLSRLIQCGDRGNATDIFRVTSESPFLYFQPVNVSWEHHCKTDADGTFFDGVIDGTGFEIIKLSALKKSHLNGKDIHRSEFCSRYIRENLSDFNINFMPPPKELSRRDLRLTVDYPEDLIVCRAVYKEFQHEAPFIDLFKVVKYLDNNEFLKNLTAQFC